MRTCEVPTRIQWQGDLRGRAEVEGKDPEAPIATSSFHE